MQSTLVPPFENRADADAAFSIVSQLGDIVERLQIAELASHQFADVPDGLLGLLSLAEQVYERWQEYQLAASIENDPEFAGLSEHILELVRMDKALSAENRDKIATLIREYYNQ